MCNPCETEAQASPVETLRADPVGEMISQSRGREKPILKVVPKPDENDGMKKEKETPGQYLSRHPELWLSGF
jgi:hypothetical protein